MPPVTPPPATLVSWPYIKRLLAGWPLALQRAMQDLAVEGQMNAEQDAFVDTLRARPGYGAPVPSEAQSLSDRLRPPYRSPVPGAAPVTADAARLLEVGYNRLPEPYRFALERAPVPATPVPVGLMADNPGGLRGIVTPSPVAIFADTPETMTHELVHELGRRGAPVPWDPQTDEALAQLVAGHPVNLPSAYYQRAAETDRMLRRYYQPEEGLGPR